MSDNNDQEVFINYQTSSNNIGLEPIEDNSSISSKDSGSVKYQQQRHFSKKNINDSDRALKEQAQREELENTKSFWRAVGVIFQICGALAIAFTVLLAFFLDNYISWSFWLIFIPVYFILFIAFVSTGSKTLSKPVSWVIRFVWRVWIVGLTVFVAFLIVYMEYGYLSVPVILIPLFATFGLTFLMGLFSFCFGVCLNNAKPSRKRKYIMSGLPMFFAGATLIPSLALVTMRFINIDDPNQLHPSWSVCFIPLFIGDAISGCFSFLLLLFTFNSKENSSFNFLQLLSLLFIILCSVVFKILYSVKLDNYNSSIPYLILFIPVFVGELFLIFCGVNLLVKPAQTHYVESGQVLVVESDSESEQKPLLNKKPVD